MVEIIPLARPLAHSGEDRVAAVFLRDVSDQLLNHHRLADTGTSEQSHFASLHKRTDEIDGLDTGFEDFRLGGLLIECRRGAMNRTFRFCNHVFLTIDDGSQHIEHPSEHNLADRHGNRSAKSRDIHPSPDTIRRPHSDGAHAIAAQMLMHFRDQHSLRKFHLERVVDVGEDAP